MPSLSLSCLTCCYSDGLLPVQVPAVGDGKMGDARKCRKSSLQNSTILVKRDNRSKTSRDRKSEQEYVKPRKETAAIGGKRVAQKRISLALVNNKKTGGSAVKKKGILGQVQGL